jgi:O-antigen/teichoic acid export membrane protein
MRVIRNTLWLSICRFGADFSGLLFFVVISRKLGPVATGQYSYAFALAAFIAILAASGLDQYGVRQYAQLRSDAERTACWRGLLCVQAVQLLCGTVLLTLAVLFSDGEHSDPIVVAELSLFTIGWGVSRTLFVPATAQEAMAAPALIEFACRTGASSGAAVLCLVGVASLPVILLTFPIAAIALVGMAARNAAAYRARLSPQFSWREFRSITRNSVPFTICEALGQFYIRADVLLITQLLGTASAGWYVADLKMIEVGVTPPYLLGKAVYPRLSRSALVNKVGLLELSEEFLRGVLFLSGWLAVGMYCLIPLVLPVLFGGQFEPAVGLLPAFSLLALTKGLEIGLARLLYATHQQNAYLRALAFGTVSIIALNLCLIPSFGMTGAIAGVVLSNVLVNLMAIARLRSDFHPIFFARVLVRLAVPLAATVLVFAALDATALNDWFAALIACGVFPVFSLACGLMPHPRRGPLFA